ncbi:MAG: hypothetical protein H6642_15490 [Caldilineaceae bacterium]|nr:hypothetical protein [Caldilineaceae bacterium]
MKDTQSRDKRLRKRLSITAAAYGISVALYSWSLFFLLPNAWNMVFTLPLWIVTPLLIAWTARRMGVKILVGKRQRWIFWLLVILLTLSAPIYSYLYGYYHVTRIFQSFEVEARADRQEAVLLDHFGDIGPGRRFSIGYEMLEPVDEVEAKIRNKLGGRSEWFLSDPDRPEGDPLLMIAMCPPIDAEGLEISLSGSGGVGIMFYYRVSASCRNIE